MTKCQVCGSKSQLFLCPRHVVELQSLLTDLPWWVDRLGEASVGDVKLGDSGKATRRREPFHGDDGALARCKCGHAEHELIACRVVDPDTLEPCACDDYKPVADQARIRAQFLAVGRVNARASQQLETTSKTVTKWLRHVCDQRRRDWLTFIEPYPGEIGPGECRSFIGPLLPGVFRRYTYPTVHDAIHWLAWNVMMIARDPQAKECLEDVQAEQHAIEKIIDRTMPMRFLGACPTWNEATRKACGTELHARADAVEVFCKSCRQTHKCARLQLLLVNDLEHEKVTVRRILELNRVLPQEYRIPERTLRRWRTKGPKGEPPKLKPRGYLRPCSCGHPYADHLKNGCTACPECKGFDGREAPKLHDDTLDEPLYLWADVRKLRAEPKTKVGAK